MQFIVTTSVEFTDELIEKAQQLADDFSTVYIPRHKQTIKQINQNFGAALVVYKQELQFIHADGTKLFFHPNTAMIRVKQMKEPLLEIIGSQPKHILDLTMGLASDAIVLSYMGHQVTALEQNKLIYTVVSHGLAHYTTSLDLFNQAMRQIKPLHAEHYSYLTTLPNKSVDIIYIDPMFSQDITESKNLAGIKPLALPRQQFANVIQEAKRVAKEKVIIKAHFRDSVFETYHFTRNKRQSAKFHFGYINL